MQKNKLYIVVLVGIFAAVLLIVFFYFSLKKDEVKKEVVEIKFEVPKSSKKIKESSKTEYYRRQNDNSETSRGIELDKRKEEKYIYQTSENVLEDYYIDDFKEDKIAVDSSVDPLEKLQDENQSASFKEPYSESNADESLGRLLNIMEKNTNQISNLGAENAVANDNDLKNLLDLEAITNIVTETKQPQPQPQPQPQNQENDPVYRRALIEKDVSKDVFFGISKDKKAFTGPVSDLKTNNKELFKAEFYTTQVVENGSLITIHLLEDIIFEDGYLISKSSILYGIAQFSGTRLFLSISPNILKNERRLPSKIKVLDFDGIEGIFMKPNLLSSIPIETAEEITKLVQDNYKSTASIMGGSATTVPIDKAAGILGSEKILKYLNRSSLKVYGGYKIWLSLK
jgi:hypothetical protein